MEERLISSTVGPFYLRGSHQGHPPHGYRNPQINYPIHMVCLSEWKWLYPVSKTSTVSQIHGYGICGVGVHRIIKYYCSVCCSICCMRCQNRNLSSSEFASMDMTIHFGLQLLWWNKPLYIVIFLLNLKISLAYLIKY